MGLRDEGRVARTTARVQVEQKCAAIFLVNRPRKLENLDGGLDEYLKSVISRVKLSLGLFIDFPFSKETLKKIFLEIQGIFYSARFIGGEDASL